MKRFLVYLVSLLAAVAAVALAVDQMNVLLIKSATGNSAYKMWRLYNNPDPDEIAIVGSSRACQNFAPSEIAPHCFNYGVEGMAKGEEISILEVLQKRQTKAPVILNLDPWGSFFNGQVADYRLVPESGRLEWQECVPGIRFFGALRKNIVAYIDAKRSVARTIDNGANLLKTSRTAAEWAAINAKLRPSEFKGNAELEKRLFTVLRSFSPRKVMVVVSPCTKHWLTYFKGKKDLDRLLSALRALSNVTVLDCLDSPEITDDDFVDPSHMNEKGARKFSRSQIAIKF